MDFFSNQNIFKAYSTEKIPGTQSDLTFNLSCWANYTFRIKAVNRLGESDPSEISTVPCYTNPCRPARHPIGVRGFGNQSNNLIITWNVSHFVNIQTKKS
jgi:neurocan core protein